MNNCDCFQFMRRSCQASALVVLFTLCINHAVSVAAETDKSFASGALPSTDWYDSDKAEIVPVKVETTVDDSANRNSRWLPKPKNSAKPATNSKPANQGTPTAAKGLFGSSLTLGNLFGWSLMVLIVITLVGFLVYALSKTEIDLDANPRSKRNGGLDATDQHSIERMKHLPAELRRTDVNMRSEAERLMSLGEYDQAVILLLAHQLLLLDRAGALRLNRGKTNGKYVRETRSVDPQLGAMLRETTDAFERSYFGRHRVTEVQFRHLWTENEKIESKVQTGHEVAA